MNEDDKRPASTTTDTGHRPSDPASVPRYEKPVLRRYDQIEQVRPYGPSEV